MLGRFRKNYKIVTKGSGPISVLQVYKPMNIKGEWARMPYGTMIALACQIRVLLGLDKRVWRLESQKKPAKAFGFSARSDRGPFHVSGFAELEGGVKC